MDAREFVKMVVKKSMDSSQTEIPEKWLRFDHCYMNLPVDAVEFLDAFIGLFDHANPKVWSEDGSLDPRKFKLPMIHVYGFSQYNDKAKAKTYFTERIGKAMNYPEFKEEDIMHFHDIRDVSSNSHMFGVSFRLPVEVAFLTKLK